MLIVDRLIVPKIGVEQFPRSTAAGVIVKVSELFPQKCLFLGRDNDIPRLAPRDSRLATRAPRPAPPKVLR